MTILHNEYNVIVIDCETLHSADDCRHCYEERDVHLLVSGEMNFRCPGSGKEGCPVSWYVPIGWDNHAALGLSIGCLYRSDTDSFSFFDMHTLEATMRELVKAQPLLVSFNGLQFDFPLMEAALLQTCPAPDDWRPGGALNGLLPAWHAACSGSYDILAECWAVDPDRKFERGLNSLGALSQANGYGAKEMDGATAPRLWAQGHHAEVANYCMSDVQKTRRLFDQIVMTGDIIRGDGRLIRLRSPFLEKG